MSVHRAACLSVIPTYRVAGFQIDKKMVTRSCATQCALHRICLQTVTAGHNICRLQRLRREHHAAGALRDAGGTCAFRSHQHCPREM